MINRAPQVGDIVHLYIGDPDVDDLPDPTAAMITEVDRDWNAELTVFQPRKSPGWVGVGRKGTPPEDQRKTPYSLHPQVGAWSWRTYEPWEE